MSVPSSFLVSLATPTPTPTSSANPTGPQDSNPKPGNDNPPQTAAGSWGSTVPDSAAYIACGGSLKPGAGYLELEKARPGETLEQQLAGYAKTLKGKPLREFVVYPVGDDKVLPSKDEIFTTGSRISGYGMKGDQSCSINKLVETVMKNNLLQKGGTLGISTRSEISNGLLTALAKKYQITIAVDGLDAGIDFHLPTGEVKTDEKQVFGEPGTRGGCGPGLQPAGDM
jgi:hypothetical protein